MHTLYDVLGVPMTASQEELRQAYQRLLPRVHPDRCFHDNDSALYNITRDADVARVRVVENAFKVLGNVDARRVYDAFLNQKMGHTLFARAPTRRVPTHSPSVSGMTTQLTAHPLPTGREAQTHLPRDLPDATAVGPNRGTARPNAPAALSLAQPAVYKSVSLQRQPDGSVAVYTIEAATRTSLSKLTATAPVVVEDSSSSGSSSGGVQQQQPVTPPASAETDAVLPLRLRVIEQHFVVHS